MIGALPLATIPPEDEALRPEIRAFLRETVGAILPERRARWPVQSAIELDYVLMAKRANRAPRAPPSG